MAEHFNISGSFPLQEGVPILQAVAETKKGWPQLDQYEFDIARGKPAKALFCFDGCVSAAFAAEIVKTVQAWAVRFADWQAGVLTYAATFEATRQHCFFGPERRCIEAKLAAIEQRAAGLQEEWNDLNFTQLAKASDECIELVDWEERT